MAPAQKVRVPKVPGAVGLARFVMINLCRAVVALVALGPGWLGAAEAAATLEKARQYLGADAALDAVNSIRYEGMLTSTETSPEGETRSVEASIEIAFQKPFRQRIVARSGAKLELTALDEYEAWQYVEDEGTSPRLTLLGREQVKRLRANTWENLSFYRGFEEQRVTLEDHGLVELDGRSVHKITFRHDQEILFVRYFDPATGQLLLTETERGDRIVEDGELVVAGVRFPERVVTRTAMPNGAHRTVTVTFLQVRVNEPLAAERFAVPLFGTQPSL